MSDHDSHTQVSSRSFRRCLIGLLVCSLVAGCVEMGRPVVAEQSRRVTPPKPSDHGYPRPKPAATDGKSSSSSKIAIPVVHTGALPKTISVNKGDTLYRLAWRYGLTFEQLARFNKLTPPYTIFPGQTLNVAGANQLPTNVQQVGENRSRTEQPKTQSQGSVNTHSGTYLPQGAWIWPLPAPAFAGFSASRKGLDFKVNGSAQVKATQRGEVVYAGNGIGGYERLVILKHSDFLLSAYSFNGRIIVAEQNFVKAGQRIADIRGTGQTEQMMHFELRRRGAPVDPEIWLASSR
ncbi:MAG: peptidoglycan DD-metalloendopeptidase family protein [Pseudomonadota bacterium]